MRIPTLQTPRLLIREFTHEDLDAAHDLLDVDLAAADTGTGGALTRAARRRWLEWVALGYEQLAFLRQPPYGDRAVALRSTGRLIGACGLVPCLAPFGQLPSLRPSSGPIGGVGDPAGAAARFTPEVGLYWAIATAHRRRGYATEAGRALMDYAFGTLRLRRVVATTDHANAASIGVMRKLGMRIDRNPLPEPPWLQVVGVRECAA